jgi:hypothetical protein
VTRTIGAAVDNGENKIIPKRRLGVEGLTK